MHQETSEQVLQLQQSTDIFQKKLENKRSHLTQHLCFPSYGECPLQTQN